MVVGREHHGVLASLHRYGAVVGTVEVEAVAGEADVVDEDGCLLVAHDGRSGDVDLHSLRQSYVVGSVIIGRLYRAVCLHRLDSAAAVGLQLDEVVLLAQLEGVLSVAEGYHLVVIALALVGGDVGRLVHGQRGLHGGVPVHLDVEGGGFSDVALIGAVDRRGGAVHLEGIEGIVRFVEFQRQLRAGLHREAGLQEVADRRSVDRHS